MCGSRVKSIVNTWTSLRGQGQPCKEVDSSRKYLGWFENGWIWDLCGRCVFVTERGNGGASRQQDRLDLLKVLAVRDKPDLHVQLEIHHGQI